MDTKSNITPPQKKEDERILNIKEAQDYYKWSVHEVNVYVLDHFAFINLTPDIKQNITQLLVRCNVDGKKLKQIGSLKQESSTILQSKEKSIGGVCQEWYDVVNSIYAEVSRLLPVAELYRGPFHPLLETVYDIPYRLGQISGVWTIAMDFYNRAVAFDQAYDGEKLWCHDRGGRPYFAPNGWRRYGFIPLKAGETTEQLTETLKDWHVGYHGSAFLNISSIIDQGLVPPNTVLKNGNKTENKRGRAGAIGNIPIYISPSIEYAAHPLYTNPKKVDGNYIYAVFQVRIHPNAEPKVQRNTLVDHLWGDVKIFYDPFYGPDELEWLLDNPDEIRVTGVMIKSDPREPHQVVKERFEKNKKIVEEREARTKEPGKWYWNCDSDYTLNDDGKFKAYSDSQNAIVEKAYKNGQQAVWLGSLKTNKEEHTTYFINFNVMEQVNCQDNTKRRRVKRM